MPIACCHKGFAHIVIQNYDVLLLVFSSENGDNFWIKLKLLPKSKVSLVTGILRQQIVDWWFPHLQSHKFSTLCGCCNTPLLLTRSIYNKLMGYRLLNNYLAKQ